MKLKVISKLISKRRMIKLAALALTMTAVTVGNTTMTYAATVGTGEAEESAAQNNSTENPDLSRYIQNTKEYNIKSISTEDTFVKAYSKELHKKLSDNSTICLDGTTLSKYDTKGNLIWEKALEETVSYSTATYNNLLIDSKDNIIVLGYYSGQTYGIYNVYDVNGNKTEYKYGTYVPVPLYEDSVTFDANENLIYQTVNATYYVYDRTAYTYTTGTVSGLDFHYYYHGTKVVATEDGGRVIVGYNKSINSSSSSYPYYPFLIKISSNNQVVFNYQYGISSTGTATQAGFYSRVYPTTDGGLIVRNKVTGRYYSINKTTGVASQITTYGTVLGFKAVNGVDYMYGKMGKTTLGDMASDIPTTTVDYILPVGQDLTKGIYFNSDFGSIKDLNLDSEGNYEVLFSCSNDGIVFNSDLGQVNSKIISVTLSNKGEMDDSIKNCVANDTRNNIGKSYALESNMYSLYEDANDSNIVVLKRQYNLKQTDVAKFNKSDIVRFECTSDNNLTVVFNSNGNKNTYVYNKYGVLISTESTAITTDATTSASEAA